MSTLLTSLRRPVVGAPMAGGVSTPLLAAAVSDAGGLGMLAAGYLPPERVAADLVHVRDLTDRPVGVNLFVPESRPEPLGSREVAALEAYRDRMVLEGERYGSGPEGVPAVDPPGAVPWTDHWEDKVALVRTLRPAVVSCTFGVPEKSVVRSWQEVGVEVHVTVTCAREAEAAAAAGADALVVQGHGAGGHRGTHDSRRDPGTLDHLALLREVRGVTGLPLVAAGGITTTGDLERARAAGAVAGQIGTALLLATEAGTSPTVRAALRDPALTTRVDTRAFTGRVAGAVRNGFVDRHHDHAPPLFPELDRLSRPVRAAAAAAGDVHGVHLWAGVGWRAAQDRSAGDIVRDLWR